MKHINEQTENKLKCYRCGKEEDGIELFTPQPNNPSILLCESCYKRWYDEGCK